MNEDKVVFAFVVDGEVFHTMVVPSKIPEAQRLIAGMMSNPIVVPVLDNAEILKYPDWKYNYEAGEFYRDNSHFHVLQQPDYEVED